MVIDDKDVREGDDRLVSLTLAPKGHVGVAWAFDDDGDVVLCFQPVLAWGHHRVRFGENVFDCVYPMVLDEESGSMVPFVVWTGSDNELALATVEDAEDAEHLTMWLEMANEDAEAQAVAELTDAKSGSVPVSPKDAPN